MNPLHRALPLLTRHAGVWEGEYVHVSPDLSTQETQAFRIKVEFPDDGPAHYRQTSHYWWPDGRTDQLVFEAAWDPAVGRLVWDNGRIKGQLWQLDDVTLYLTFGFDADPGSYVCEMIQLGDGEHRVRTWHWFRAHAPWRLTLVRERRVSLDPSEFERRSGAPRLPHRT
jgi:hypothetical protein